MSRRTKKPKREFSKLILYVVGAVTVGVTAFTLIMVWKTENLEPLAYLIPAIFAELATATGFYYSKAKAENRIKLRIKSPLRAYFWRFVTHSISIRTC